MDDRWEGFRKPNFGAPPSGYVAGIGRGATGFVTRSDLGPAKLQAAQPKQNDDADYVESKYDAWSGYSGALFSKKPMNEQDREAEQTYNSIEDRMDGKRRQQRQLKQKSLAKLQTENKTIADGFSDLKREMAKVSYDDWLNLPQSADSSLKKKKKEKYVPVPDAIMMGFLNDGQTVNNVVPTENMNQLKQAKQIMLKSQLDKASDKYKNQTVVDKTGYLTSLNGLKMNEESYIGDLKRARLVLKSATNTTPQNPEVWMCAARVQELDGKLYEARAIINQGLEHCKTSEDLWIQASRLEKPQLSKSILIKGLSFLPSSEKLWLTSARKEHEKQIKAKILKKGLEVNSCSLALWKQIIELSNSEEAKELLRKAVQCLPKQIDLWLALAKLQNYEVAKSVLNKARKNNPLQFKIWIAAAELQQTETNNSGDIVSKIQNILIKANQVLSKNGIIVKKDDWLEEAILCQKKGNFSTCEAIVKLTFTISSEPQLQNTISSKCLELQQFQQCAQTIRYLFQHGTRTLNSRILMQKYITYQRLKGSPSDLRKALDISVKLFPNLEQFWIASAANYLKNKEYKQALNQLQSGLSILLDSQKIQLLKVDIYIESKQTEMAEQLLQQLRQSARIQSWIKSIQYYYRLKNFKKAWQLSEKAYKLQTSQRIVELAFKIQKKLNGYNHAKTIIEKAVQKFEKSLNLWVKFAQLEIQNGYLAKARTVLQKARIKLPKCQDLYVLSINLQIKTGNTKAALFVLSKGLAEIPKSGNLWALAVDMEPRNTRLKKIAEAENACSDNPEIYVSAAKIFWRQNKLQKCKKWLQRAIILNPSNGDSWAYFFSYLSQFQPHHTQAALQKFKSNVINDGRRWKAIISNQQSNDPLPNQLILERIVKQIKLEMNKLQ